MPNPDSLHSIEARLAKATKGPWKLVNTPKCAVANFRHYDLYYTDKKGENWSVFCLAYSTYAKYVKPDADLIAHAPTDLTTLCALVRRYREALTNLRAMHQDDSYGACSVCFKPHTDGDREAWPCPAIQAIDAALAPSEAT